MRKKDRSIRESDSTPTLPNKSEPEKEARSPKFERHRIAKNHRFKGRSSHEPKPNKLQFEPQTAASSNTLTKALRDPKSRLIYLDDMSPPVVNYTANKSYPVIAVKLMYNWTGAGANPFGDVMINFVYPVYLARSARARVANPMSLATFANVIGYQAQLLHAIAYLDAIVNYVYPTGQLLEPLYLYRKAILSDSVYQNLRANLIQPALATMTLPPVMAEIITKLAQPLDFKDGTIGLRPPPSLHMSPSTNYGTIVNNLLNLVVGQLTNIKLIEALFPEWKGVTNLFEPDNFVSA